MAGWNDYANEQAAQTDSGRGYATLYHVVVVKTSTKGMTKRRSGEHEGGDAKL